MILAYYHFEENAIKTVRQFTPKLYRTFVRLSRAIN
nr:MAG TPA: hypothetical protein [Caudoviricetes sp.]